MILWLAGNFPQMKDPELEKASRDLVLKDYPNYNRLLSFFYESDIVNVLEIKKETDNDNPQSEENSERECEAGRTETPCYKARTFRAQVQES